jgi:hypothetical protein
VQLLERPHHALHERDVHGLVVVGHVDPAGLAVDVGLPRIGRAADDRAAELVEAVDPVLEDGDAARHAERGLGLHLHRQPVAVPPEPALDAVAAHRAVARHRVLHEPGEQVAVVGHAVGERRAVVEHELRRRTELDRRLEGAVGPPTVDHRLLQRGEARGAFDVGVGPIRHRRFRIR